MTEHPTARRLCDPSPIEVRFTVDPTETPLAYPAAAWPDGRVADLDVELAGPGVVAALTVPLAGARAWAGELFSAVSVAYWEVTGDPHALTDLELASLPDSDAYDPPAGVLVHGEDDDSRAQVRFYLAVDIQGRSLSTADLRAALVDHLSARFNISRVAVSKGDVIAGRPWSPPGAA